MGWTKFRGKELERKTQRAMSEAVKRTAGATLGEALKLVPLDEGVLQQTGMTKENPNNPLEYAVSFGGGFGTPFTRVPYAIRHHEIPSNFQHGRQHNYLRTPINTFTPNALKKELKKAGEKSW